MQIKHFSLISFSCREKEVKGGKEGRWRRKRRKRKEDEDEGGGGKWRMEEKEKEGERAD